MPDFTIPSDNEEDSLSLEPNTSAFEDGPAELEYTIVPNGSQRGKPRVPTPPIFPIIPIFLLASYNFLYFSKNSYKFLYFSRFQR